jgi:hypothetical protein
MRRIIEAVIGAKWQFYRKGMQKGITFKTQIEELGKLHLHGLLLGFHQVWESCITSAAW